MRHPHGALLRTAILLAAILVANSAGADFFRVTNFDDLILGPIDGQDGWYAEHETSAVSPDPGATDNQVLSVTTESTHLYREFVLPGGGTRMVFLRFRYESQLIISFGLTDAAAPSRFDHFEVELSLSNATNELRINDDGHYATLAILQPGTWYNCWLLIDNDSDRTQVWLHDRPGDRAYAEDQLMSEGEDLFDFRNGTSGDLINFYIKSGGGNGVAGPLLLDDLYSENTSTLNLYNPGEPTAIPSSAPAAAGALASPYPNPFNPSVTIPYRTNRSAEALITLHDASGKLVREIHAGSKSAGLYEVEWNGRDGSGGSLPSGVYAARLVLDGRSVGMVRMVLLK